MANRNYNRKQALEKEVKEIYAKVTIGASGAPTLVAANSQGVASISRTSAGLYVLTLQDKYMKLMHASFDVTTPTISDIKANLKSESVASAKTVTFHCSTGAIATDPADGDSFLISLQLKNSSV
jgi:hypothetical protein